MCGFNVVGGLAIIPVTVLLTISFFVLVVLSKTQAQGIKTFGYVIVLLLWLSAALIVAVGVYTMVTGRHPILHHMMKGGMEYPMLRPPVMNR